MTFVMDAKPSFEKVIDHLQKELSTIRTGRATPALVEDIQVEAYGAYQPLKSLASIGTPDARTIQIEPWDGSVVKPVETALMKAELGMTPTVDGKVIRLNLPIMTDEDRQRLVKQMKERLEDARIAVRQIREEVKKEIEKQEGVGEDVKRSEIEALEKTVKEYNEKVAAAGEKKEKEITTI